MKDENGRPANGFPVTLRQADYDYEASSQTDADGCCTLFLLEPGGCRYEVGGSWAHGDSVYLPISESVSVDEGMLQETVSFEGYRRLSLRVKGNDEWDMSLPTVWINGVYEDFPMALDKSASTMEYAGHMMMPQGITAVRFMSVTSMATKLRLISVWNSKRTTWPRRWISVLTVLWTLL